MSQRRFDLIMTWLLRHNVFFYLIMTLLLRHVSAGIAAVTDILQGVRKIMRYTLVPLLIKCTFLCHGYNFHTVSRNNIINKCFTSWVFDIFMRHSQWPHSKLAHEILHYSDVIMGVIASQITGVSIVCSPVSSGADLRKLQSSASLAFARGILRWPVTSSYKGPVARKMFPFDDVII